MPGERSGDGGGDRPEGPHTHFGDDEEPERGLLSSPRLTIARRELASLRSEKTIVLALLIQLFVAAFSSFLVVGLVSLYDPGSVDGYTLDVGVAGNDTADLTGIVEDQDSMTAVQFDSERAALEAFDAGSVDAVLAVERTDNGTLFVSATAPDGSIRTTLTVVQLQSVLEEYERTEREQRAAEIETRVLDAPEEIATSPYFGFTYTVLIPLLMFLPVFISGSVAVDSMTEEIQRGTLEILRVAPVTTWDIVDAKLLATATLAPVQAGAWLVLLSLNGTLVANPALIVVVVAGLSLAVTAVGLGISVLAPDRRQAQFLYSSGVLAVVGATTLLPEHPANTIARLAVGSVGATTLPAVAGYVVIGVGSYLAIKALVARVGIEGL